MMTRKFFVLGYLLLSLTCSYAQDGFNIGASVKTSFQLNSHRNKSTTLWSSESGYGFSFGIPFRYGYSEDRSFTTGIDYEFMAFDNWVNNSLVSSMRINSIHVPLNLNFKLISSLYWTAGTGLNVFFLSRTIAYGQRVNIGNVINPFQPYLALGIGSMTERGSGWFDLGFNIRYHFLDLWKKSYPTYEAASSKIISFDLAMKFYF